MTHWIEFLGDECIHALGWTFVHTLWQGSLLAVIMIFALSRISHQNARLRYRWAFGCLVSMLIMAVTTFTILYDVSDAAVAETFVLSNTAPVAETASGGLMYWLNSNLSLLVAIWIVGMVILLARLGIGLLYIERLRRTSQIVGSEIEELTAKLARQLGYANTVRIAQTPMVNMPVVMGVFKPVILFPIGAINQLNVEEVEAILAHELAHLVRNDFLQNIVQSLIETIFYYHPAIWWISAVVRTERENCCDDLAIKACGSHLTYARALVHLQDMGQSRPALALPFLGSKHHLLKRVKRILNQPQNKSNIMEKITATGLLVLCLIFASFNGGTDSEEAADVINLHVEDTFTSYVQTDTVPHFSTIKVHRDFDGKRAEMTQKNGKITSFIVDGEEIPPSDYARYQGMIDALEEDIANLPPPPPPPAAPMPPKADKPGLPDAAPLPPAPPLPGEPRSPELAPSPSQTPATKATPATKPSPATKVSPAIRARRAVKPFVAPPPPPPPPNFTFPDPHAIPFPPSETRVKQRTESMIIRESDAQGNVVYRLESEGDAETAIIIDEASGVALIDGQEIIIDSDTIIVIEEVESRVPGGMWREHAFGELPGAWIAQDKDAQYFFDQAREFNFEFAKPDSLSYEGYSKALEQYQNSFEKKDLERFFNESGEAPFGKIWDQMDCDSNRTGELFQRELNDKEDALFYLREAQDARDWAGPNEKRFWKDTDSLTAFFDRNGQPAVIAKELADKEWMLQMADSKVLDKERVHLLRDDTDKADAYILSGQVSEEVTTPTALNAYVLAAHRGGQERIVDAMAEEGLIDPDGVYSVVLSENKLKINGKKMPEDTLEKYKQLYERTLGHNISGKTKIEISNE